VGQAQQAGRGGPPLPHGLLRGRAEGRTPERRHVEPEKEVAHGGVADHDDLEHLVPVHAAAAVRGLELAVQRPAQHPAQLPGLGCLVRDPAHHVAAAEALRVLEGRGLQGPPRLEVHQLKDDRGGADVERETEQPAGRGPDRLAPIQRSGTFAGDHRVEVERRPRVGPRFPADLVPRFRGAQDPQPSAQDREANVSVVALDNCLAGESEPVWQEGLGRGRLSQRLRSLVHLHDALAAASGAPARGGNPHGQLVGSFEQRPAGPDRTALVLVDQLTHGRFSGLAATARRRCPECR